MNLKKLNQISAADIPYMDANKEREVALKLSNVIYKSAVKLAEIHFVETGAVMMLKRMEIPIPPSYGDVLDVILDLLHVPECSDEECEGDCIRMPYRAESVRMFAAAKDRDIAKLAAKYCEWALDKVKSDREASSHEFAG